MKFTQEAYEENQKTINKIFSCSCGKVLMIKRPVANDDNVLDYFHCICPECETQWKVRISFEEI